MFSSPLLVDRSAQGKIVLTGSDRASFLHGLLTNDITRLVPGTGTYAAYLTPQGRMISDMRVIETGDSLLLDVEASVVGQLAERLEKLIFSEDVAVLNATASLAEFGIHGASADDVIQRVAGHDVSALVHQYDNARVTIAASDATVVRDDSLGLLGFDIYVPSSHADRVRAAFLAAGASEAEEGTAEALRIEAGRPRFGVDMGTETIPLEAGIEDRAISFTKGCYVGQEVIIRVMHRGHGRVARRLVRLILAGGAVPSRGDKIFAGDQPVGDVTSAAVSPRTAAPIAMGYVHRDHAAPGTELSIGSSKAVVHQLAN
ncbi:MAG TPA: glycine cleavage T C-terminal barrel domain-containing protein [Vicinamibacterales bacterium]|nr:glycine cleavage T C-terminal barrel domain-containing protein [Vicinamibacterales bacterium]